MHIVFRILSILTAIFFSLSTFNWIFDPATAAQSLGMELLTGPAASTQIGDIGAFFFSASIFMWWAQLPGKSQWFYAVAVLIGLAALMRTVAWILGHADFMAALVISELVIVLIMVGAARMRADEV